MGSEGAIPLIKLFPKNYCADHANLILPSEQDIAARLFFWSMQPGGVDRRRWDECELVLRRSLILMVKLRRFSQYIREG